jgi:pullulanase/glycogen debranching enzyme
MRTPQKLVDKFSGINKSIWTSFWHQRRVEDAVGAYQGLAEHSASADDPDIHVMTNMHWEALDMETPAIPGRQWTRIVDSSLPSPSDIAEPGTEVACPGQSYRVNGRSIVVLVNKPA